jgi:opacity protein-like surface antigen
MRNLAIAMMIIALPCVSSAQGNRAYSWEASVSGIFQESKSISGDAGSSLNVDSDTGFGINIAYNLSSKLSLGMDFEYLKPDYVATLVDDTGMNDDLVINHEMTQFNARFKGTFNLMEGPFTPFLEGGLGWSNFDSNVVDGPPATGCWWHPWYGYICSNFYNTYDETLFTYGAGAGIRWQFPGGSFLKASYNYWEMDGMGQSEDSALEAGRIEFGWGF